MIKTDGWRYYNHAIIPVTPPHKAVDITSVNDGSIWKISEGKPLLARWTDNFDCGYETNWWYVIKDTPFDISSLKAKRRYEINKGNKHFEVRLINPCEYKDELYNVQVAAFSAYPKKYRPQVDYDEFTKEIDGWEKYKIYGAFFKESGKLCGYSMLEQDNEYISFNVQKTVPEYESYAINAALVNKIVEDHNELLGNGGYICDGARSISHETAFQDYLEKYFGFRKAYCRLYIRYKPIVGAAIKILFPFRNILSKLDSLGPVHQINGLLKMEEIVRKN